MIDEKAAINDIREWSEEREIKWTSESVISLLESAPSFGNLRPCKVTIFKEVVIRPSGIEQKKKRIMPISIRGM